MTTKAVRAARGTEHLVTLAEVPASGPGALAGFEVSCSCGNVQRTSLKSEASRLATDHLDWHARTGR